jgi:metal-sulfur cluster biosynthetic enzyme
MTGSEDSLPVAIKQALRMVVDPELGENVVDLGLVYGVAVENGVAYVEMTTTMRGCPATAYLKDAVQSAAWSVPGIDYVEIKLTYEPAWTPAMIREGTEAALRFR